MRYDKKHYSASLIKTNISSHFQGHARSNTLTEVNRISIKYSLSDETLAMSNTVLPYIPFQIGISYRYPTLTPIEYI